MYIVSIAVHKKPHKVDSNWSGFKPFSNYIVFCSPDSIPDTELSEISLFFVGDNSVCCGE